MRFTEAMHALAPLQIAVLLLLAIGLALWTYFNNRRVERVRVRMA